MQDICSFKTNRTTTTYSIPHNFLELRLSVLLWTMYLVIDIVNLVAAAYLTIKPLRDFYDW